MKVKLRPGTHLAPVPQGLYVAGRGPAFVLTAPAVVYQVLDAQLGLLCAGTDVEELVAAVGNPAARPLLERVIRALLERDVLLDLDALVGPCPDVGDATRFAELLAYLEAHCAQPYDVFARLRATTVAVRGAGPAIGPLRRTLQRYGVNLIDDQETKPAVLVVVDDADAPLDPTTVWFGDAECMLVPVLAHERLAIVGAPCTTTEQVQQLLAAARRAQAWTLLDAELAAPRPLSAVLAGALGGHVVLRALVETFMLAQTPDDAWTAVSSGAATIVYGPHVATQPLPLTDPQESPAGWVDTNDEDPLPADETLTAWTAVTARWTGVLRRARDERLPQLPFSLATVDVVPVQPSNATSAILGWGTDRAKATINAMLAAARLRDEPALPPGALTAAGITPRRFLLDGALRLLADELSDDAGGRVDWEDLELPHQRALWSLCEDYYATKITVALHEPFGGAAFATAGNDLWVVGQWGTDRRQAIQLSLAAAVARLQAQPAQLSPQSVGTAFLESAPAGALAPVEAALRAHLAARGRTLATHPINDELPFVHGWVCWA